jgi:hypothetical protein
VNVEQVTPIPKRALLVVEGKVEVDIVMRWVELRFKVFLEQ